MEFRNFEKCKKEKIIGIYEVPTEEQSKKMRNKITLRHYQGSLDFPCDICKSNSYDNLHIIKNGIFTGIVLCKKCIDKCFEE